MGACDTPGWAMNIVVVGTTAYVADGAFGLRIVDLSDSAHPQEAGSFEVNGLARRVAVAGSFAFVADQRGGLRTVDVADPAYPVQVSQYSPVTGSRRVAVDGAYAYVAAEFQGLRVMDVSDPAHPTGSCRLRLRRVCRGCGRLTATMLIWLLMPVSMEIPYSLHVLDISDPAHPTRVGAIPWCLPEEYKDLALDDDILYVVYG